MVEPERRIEREERGPISTLAIVLIIIVVVATVGATTVFLWFLPIITHTETNKVTGSGTLVSREMDFRDFYSVEVGNAFEVEITRSSSYRISVTADDNLFDYIQVSKSGDTLKIDLKSGYSYQWPLTLRAKITMPDLRELEFSGATSGTIEGFSTTQKIVLTGASGLNMADMSVGDIEIRLDGASRLEGQGQADDLTSKVAGASHLNLENFRVNDADVNLSSASHATINLDGRLDADISGASHLKYLGEPTMGDVKTSGGSTVSRK
jgi:hypothetical protein